MDPSGEIDRVVFGTPDTNRTCDLPLRRGLLYPLSYRGVGWTRYRILPLEVFSLLLITRIAVLFVLALPAHAQTQTWGWDDGTVPYVQTPMEIVERMLRMAEVKQGDHVIDLGSGDGRIVIEAAKRGATGLGVDLDASLVKLATENAAKAGVADKAQFRVMDL